MKKSFTFSYLSYNNYYIRSYIKKNHNHIVLFFVKFCTRCASLEVYAKLAMRLKYQILFMLPGTESKFQRINAYHFSPPLKAIPKKM